MAALCAGVLLAVQGVAAAAVTPKTASVPAAAKTQNAPKVVDAKADSVRLLEKAVARDSSNFDNLYRLGVMYLDRDRALDATKVLTKAHQLRSKDVPTLVNLGAAHDALGHSAVAQQDYKSALDLAPDDSIAVCRLASSLYANGKYEDAVNMLQDLIKKKPGSYCAYFTMGVAFADAGIYREAMRLWQKVVDLAPNSPEAISAKESISVLQKFVKEK